MIPDKPLESLAPCLVGRDGKPLARNGMSDNQDLESCLSEEELLDEEDEANMSLLPQNVRPLLHVTLKHGSIPALEISKVIQQYQSQWGQT